MVTRVMLLPPPRSAVRTAISLVCSAPAAAINSARSGGEGGGDGVTIEGIVGVVRLELVVGVREAPPR